MINLFVVHSIIEDTEIVASRTSDEVSEILKSSNKIELKGIVKNIEELKLIFKDKNEGLLGTIILNTSGGTEAIIKKITEETNKPVLILADSKKNSFASSLESYAYLRERYKIKIFYNDDIPKKVNAAKNFSIALIALQEVNESHFCLLGDPSDWLLTSQEFTDFSPFDTKYTKISVDNINEAVSEIGDEQTNEIIESWKNNYDEILVENRSLIDSVKVYKALKKIIGENNADVISVRCFDLLKHNYTACMGLSICNDEGITAGCEGDIPATFTMLIAQKLSGQAVWMANPSSISFEKNQIIFAHCTVPSNFLSDIKEAGLTTHMESGKSTAIRGPLKETGVSVLRIGNDFKKIVAVTGRILESDMKNINLCRTQAVIQINGSAEKWVDASLGNHQVIVYGDIMPILEYFCEFSGIELLEI